MTSRERNLFVVFEKKKLSIDARLNNMGGCRKILVRLYMCLMAKRFGEALSVEEASKRIRNAVPKSATDDLDEYLASLYCKELVLLDSKDSKCESQVKDDKSEVQGSGILLQNLICNNNLYNAAININVNLSKLFVRMCNKCNK